MFIKNQCFVYIPNTVCGVLDGPNKWMYFFPLGFCPIVNHPAKSANLLSDIKHSCVFWWNFRNWHFICFSRRQAWTHDLSDGTFALVMDLTFVCWIFKDAEKRKNYAFLIYRWYLNQLLKVYVFIDSLQNVDVNIFFLYEGESIVLGRRIGCLKIKRSPDHYKYKIQKVSLISM